jgi:hypothetical protein
MKAGQPAAPAGAFFVRGPVNVRDSHGQRASGDGANRNHRHRSALAYIWGEHGGTRPMSRTLIMIAISVALGVLSGTAGLVLFVHLVTT